MSNVQCSMFKRFANSGFTLKRFANSGFTLKRFANSGFTLIEILVSIGMVAILSAGVVSLIGQGPKQGARDARRWADLNKIASALELYRTDQGGYPTAANYACSGALPCLMPTYINPPLPTDPKTPTTAYVYTSTGTTYTLCANGMEKISCATANCCVRNP